MPLCCVAKVSCSDLNMQRVTLFDFGIGKDESRKHSEKSAANQYRNSQRERRPFCNATKVELVGGDQPFDSKAKKANLPNPAHGSERNK